MQKPKVGIPTQGSRIPYNHWTQSTNDFFNLDIPYAEEFPKGKFKLNNHEKYFRALPLISPTMGFTNIKNYWFFAPYSRVWGGWNQFITQTPSIQGTGGVSTVSYPTATPGVDIQTIRTLFQNSVYGLSTAGTVTNFDFTDGSTTATYYLFTKEGRYIYKIFKQLGYDFIEDDYTNPSTARNKKLSALPMIALAQICLEYLTNKNWNSVLTQQAIWDSYKNDKATSSLTLTHLVSLVALLKMVCFEDDLFMQAWVNPNGPNDLATGQSSYQINDITSNLSTRSAVWYNNNSLAPYVERESGNVDINLLTQYNINTLRALDKYIHKMQLTGTHYWERLMTLFGINHTNSDEPIKILNESQTLKVTEVTSMASTNNAELGDMAGKAESFDRSNFTFEFEEYGMLFNIQTIIPSVAYGQSMKKQVLRSTNLDYYTPEFDGIGPEAIESMEYYIPKGVNDTNKGKLADSIKNQIYGFFPRYYDYKTKVNRVYGDISLDSLNATYRSWTLMRVLAATHFPTDTNNGYNIKQFLGNTIGLDNFQSQFDRIFYTSKVDNFITWNLYEYEFRSSMKSLFAYDDLIDNDEKAIKLHNNNMEADD